MKRVRIARSARADLDEIRLYVAEHDGIDAAQRVVDSITGTFEMLGRHPRSGRSRDDIGSVVRSFVTSPYRVYYRVSGSHVRVLNVRR